MIGYHANDGKRCLEFVENQNFLIIDNQDTDFLGCGMYFWEHLSRAQWWKKEKNKEMITKAELNLTNMLDLTDDEVAGYVEVIADKLTSAMNRKGIKQHQIGLKLDYLFESCKCFSDRYSSIRANYYYKKKQESVFFYGFKFTNACIDIYSIRNKPELVTNREVVNYE